MPASALQLPPKGRRNSSETDFSLHKYHILSLQQEHLRQRLSLSIPSDHPLSSLPSTSPVSSSRSMTSSFSSLPPVSSYPYPAPSHTTPNGHSELEEERLFELNHQIKATLTELLNTSSVKHDTSFRFWVQSRLMDAEIELKKQRRRRGSTDKEALIDSIAEHLENPVRMHYRASI